MKKIPFIAISVAEFKAHTNLPVRYYLKVLQKHCKTYKIIVNPHCY